MNTIINPIEQVAKSPESSETYGFINTRSILDTFEAKGWVQSGSKTAKPRRLANIGFQKHLVTLENPLFPSIPGLSAQNASRPQLVLVNSHDSTSALHVYFGAFRLACLNGIIAGTGLGYLRVVHSDRFLPKLSEGLDSLLTRVPTFIEQVAALQNKSLSPAAYQELCTLASSLRLPKYGVTECDGMAYTRIKRGQDNGQDAFTQFNRVQEIALRGGLRYLYNAPVDDTGTTFCVKRGTTRAINSVSKTVSINQALFNKTLELVA